MKIKGKTVLAMISPYGDVLADSKFKDENDVWQIVLGWPAQEEIDAAKAKGYFVTYVTVEYERP